jgi:hypothetical protein
MRRKRLLVLVAATVAVFALLLRLEIAVEANGHSIDPTDPMNYNTYALRNDSATQLYVHLCAGTKCARLERHIDWVPVTPGSAVDEQVYWGSSTPAVYAVATAPDGSGVQLCVALDASKKAPAKVDAPLSSGGSCGS